jgi:hypothetical protein
MSNLPTLPFSIDFRVIYIGYMGQLRPWARLTIWARYNYTHILTDASYFPGDNGAAAAVIRNGRGSQGLAIVGCP